MSLTEKEFKNILSRTEKNLEATQRDLVLSNHNLDLVSVESYIYNNQVYKLSKEDSKNAKIFKSYNFPLLTNSNHVPTFLYTLKVAVSKNLVTPMILTKSVNGEELAISWDDIIIVRDGVDIYMIIYGIDPKTESDNFKCLLIPYSVSYKNKLSTEDDFPEIGFVFDSDGFAITDKYKFYQASMSISINNEYLDYAEYTFDDSTIGFVLDDFNNGRLVKESIIMYYNNTIVTNNDKYIEYIGNNTFKFLDPEYAKNTIIKVFYNNSVDESIDNIFKLSNDGFNYINNMNLYNTVPDNYKNILINLDSEELDEEKILKYRKDIIYPNNVNTDINANYIYSYSIKGADMKRDIDDETGLSTLISGRWLDDDGILNNLFYPIVFVNDRLYNRYGSLKRDKGLKFTLNTNKIQPDDDVEMYFIGHSLVNNKEIIKVPSSTKTVRCGLDLTDCMLFEEKPNPVNYPNIAYDENACFQYSIDFTCTKNEDGTYTIIFNDDKYYDTKVVAVSNRQFLVYGDVSEGGENVCIDLPKDFEYAQNIDHYMVFVNGKKIDNDDLIFNFPKEDNPFPHISIYSTILFGDGDSVCVIYMPYSVKTAYKADSINPNGIIKLNNLLPCGLNTENILLFINGYKVSNKEINIISDDVLQINSKYVNSTKNLSIIIPDILPALPVDLYKSDSWNEIIDGLTDNDLDTLFSTTTIKNTDTDIYDNQVQRKAVLLEIFRDYYSDLYEGDPFEYDGTEEILDENDKDIDMNYIIRVADSSKKNSINFNNLG